MKQMLKEYFSVKGLKLLTAKYLIYNGIYAAINTHILYVISKIISGVAAGEDTTTWMAVLVTEMMISTVISVLESYQRRRIVQISYNGLVLNAVDKILHTDYDNFTKLGEGYMHSVIASVSAIVNGSKAVINSAMSALQLIALVVAIVAINYKLIVPIVIIYAIAAFPMYKIVKKVGALDEAVHQAKVARTDEFQKVVSGFAELRASGMEDAHYDKFKELNQKTYDAITRKTLMLSANEGFLNIVDSFCTMAVILYGFMMIPAGIATTLVMSLVSYAWRLMGPMETIMYHLDEISATAKQSVRYRELMDMEDKVKDGVIEMTDFESEIIFQDVGFWYNKSNAVLQDVSFKIKKGEKVGIVGSSGCGKTTLIKLLERFYDPSDGIILIDGIDIESYRIRSLREHIGYIQQDVFIFKGTILENILYGTKKIYTMAVVEEACRKASILSFIQSLPEGFETDIGPGGLKLSGGQKQRLALARLFLKDPDIILLDEATSALDNESEKAVQESLQKLQDKTIITVAHRLTTVKDCDKIVVFDQHRIREIGTHEELLSYGGTYASLWCRGK